MTDDWDAYHAQLYLPDGQQWEALRTILTQQYDDQIETLRLSLNGERAVLDGLVFSLEVKTTLERVILANTSVSTIDNHLVVSSPLYSAGDPFDDFVGAHQVDLDLDPSSFSGVIRYPDIRTTEVATPGDVIDVVADLGLSPNDNVDGGPIVFDDGDWTSLDVDVEIHSLQLDIAPQDRRGVIRIRRLERSIPTLFSGKVVADAQEVTIQLTFSLGGRFCGSASRTLEVKGVQKTIAAEPINKAGDGSLSLERNATPPDLTVKIYSGGRSDGQCTWSFETSPALRHIGATNTVCTSSLGGESPKDYFLAKFQMCPVLPAGAHAGALRGIGERISEIVPADFLSIYRAVHDAVGPGFTIQILTDEPYVPWELMFLGASVAGEDGHLLLLHPVARWALNERAAASSFGFGQRISFVPSYERGATLPAAEEEGRWLHETHGVLRAHPTFADFVDLLTEPPVDKVQLVHFAGHGASEGPPNAIGLRMQDHWVAVENINSSVKLGERDAPLFILNACQVGSSNVALGSVVGWPSQLAKRSFGGIVAPLWSVQDEHASLYVRSLVEQLFDAGATIGRAALAARLQHQSASSSAYAYLTYGDVMAKAQQGV
ncbi:hypothetical protein ABIB57_001935 [Devosia sp. UYZn731]|uniref:CHAT domain-containing protein n=1 Tax=Devosia sp. UYZn731 TaxID=3156345 RepID=UPI003394A578